MDVTGNYTPMICKYRRPVIKKNRGEVEMTVRDSSQEKAAGGKSAEDLLLENEWAKVEEFVRLLGRPDPLFPVEKDKTALMIMDMQVGFMAEDAPLGYPAARSVVDNINRLSKACRGIGIPVIWVFWEVNTMDDWGLVAAFYPPAPDGSSALSTIMADAAGARIWPELVMDVEKDYQVGKCRYSAFIKGASEAEKLLHSLARDHIVMTGIDSSVCVGASAMDAMALDFKVTVVSDATTTKNNIYHQVFLMELKKSFADVQTTEAILKMIKDLR